MKKQFICLMIAVAMCFTFTSCANTLPPDDTDLEDPKEAVPDPDMQLFNPADNQIFYKVSLDFANIPGMVLVMDQWIHYGGAHLSYIHKTNHKEYYFCFDPLCHHLECKIGYAGEFIVPWFFVWSPANQQLYSLRMKSVPSALSDGALYRFDILTQETEVVVPSDGNRISAIFAGDRYILLERDRADSGREIIRYDPLTDQYQTITPPSGRVFRFFYAAGDTILLKFMDDPVFYLTDPTFSSYKKTSLTTLDFIAGRMAYLMVDEDENPTYYPGLGRSIASYNLDTGETQLLITREVPGLSCVGCDGDYIYYHTGSLYSEDPRRIGLNHTTLYRVSVDGGDEEVMMDFSADSADLAENYYPSQVVRFDGVLYILLHPVASHSTSGDIYGMLVEENGAWQLVQFTAGD